VKNADRIRGVWCAMLTPVTANATVDLALFNNHARMLLSRGVDGLAPFGTTGEGQSFSVAQRRAGVDALLAAGIPAERIMPGTGCAALADTIELTSHAVENGCRGVLVLPPFFFEGVGDDGVLASYRGLIEGVGDNRLRIYLYHIPQVTGVPIGAAAIERLVTEFPDVIAGVKDSAGNLEHSLALVRRFPTLNILVGHEPHLPDLLAAGGAGTVCGLSNLYPDVLRRLHDATTDRERHDELAFLRELLAALKPHSPMPAMKAIRALQSGEPRWRNVMSPLVSLGDTAQVRLKASVEALSKMQPVAA
jgi:4-hydroxy-tetrahydrodipicolinate synthase